MATYQPIRAVLKLKGKRSLMFAENQRKAIVVAMGRCKRSEV